MTDMDFTGLATATTVSGTDNLVKVEDPSGSKPHKRITLTNFIKGIFKLNQWENGASISNPDSGYMAMYADSSGFFYVKNSSGTARKLNPVRYFQLTAFPVADSVTTGDDKVRFDIPADISGMNLVYCLMTCDTVSSSGLPTVQIRNVTDSVDMLSTKLSIDENEYTSLTAATTYVIDGTKDDVAEGDRLAIDCDIAGTGTKGLRVTLGFQYP